MKNNLFSLSLFLFLFYSATVLAEHQESSDTTSHPQINTRPSLKNASEDTCLKGLTLEQIKILSDMTDLTHGQKGTAAKIDNPIVQASYMAMQVLEKAHRQNIDWVASDPKKLKLLEQAGVQIKDQQVDLSHLDLTQWDQVRPVLADIFPEAASQFKLVKDPNNHSPIVLGHSVIMPLSSVPRKRVLSMKEYQAAVQNLLHNFQVAMTEYVSFSNENASGISQTTDSLRRSYMDSNYQSNASKMAEKNYNLALSLVAQLQTSFGYPPAKTAELRNQIFHILNENKKNIDVGLNQFELAALAVTSAPLVWPLLALGGASFASGFFVGLGTTALDIGISASIDASRGNGGVLCNLATKLLEKGPTGLWFSMLSGGLLKGTSYLFKAGGLAPQLVKHLG